MIRSVSYSAFLFTFIMNRVPFVGFFSIVNGSYLLNEVLRVNTVNYKLKDLKRIVLQTSKGLFKLFGLLVLGLGQV